LLIKASLSVSKQTVSIHEHPSCLQKVAGFAVEDGLALMVCDGRGMCCPTPVITRGMVRAQGITEAALVTNYNFPRAFALHSPIQNYTWFDR
jgi:hypothetical protein